MTAPALLLRRTDFRELRVLTGDDGDPCVYLSIGRPDCSGAHDELQLSRIDAIELANRLLHHCIRLQRAPDSAGPLSSTF